MKKITILFLFVCCIFFSYSQQMQFNWLIQAGGPEWDVVTDITELPDGNIAIAGAYYESIRFSSDTLQSKGSRDIFIALFSKNGDLKKVTSIGGEGFDYAKKIESTHNGVIMPVRFNRSTEVFGHIFKNNFTNNILLIWLDEELSLFQNFLFSSSKEFDITEIKSLPDSSCVFTGWFTDTLKLEDHIYKSKGKKDSFIGKLSAEGKLQWFRQIQGDGDDLVTALATNETGDKYYFCGTSDKGCLLPEIARLKTTEEAHKHLFFAKADETGTVLNFEYVLSGTDLMPLAIMADSAAVWILTNFKNTAITNRKQKISAFGKNDALLFNVDYPDSTFRYCQINGQGNIEANRLVRSGEKLLITGQYSGKATFGSSTIESAAKGTDIFIAMVDDHCIPLNIFSLTGESNEFPCSAFATKSGVYVAGEFKGKLEVENTELVSAGKEDIFLARVENCSNEKSPYIEITVLEEDENETVWELDAGPEYITYSWNDDLSSSRYTVTDQPGTYTVTVTDIFGCVYSSEIELAAEKSSFIKPDETGTEFKVYPTLTSNYVYWEPASVWENLSATVSVFDSSGRKISQQELTELKPQTYSINMSGETNGTYLLEISGKSFREITKITIKK